MAVEDFVIDMIAVLVGTAVGVWAAVARGALVALAVTLAVRNWRVAVRIEPGVVVVQGVWRTRRIPIEKVTQVRVSGNGPAEICWKEAPGRWREAELPGFWAHTVPTAINLRNRAVLQRLDQAINANRWRSS